MEFLSTYFNEVWSITKELAPYLLLGLVIAGLLELFVKRSFVLKHLGKNNFSSTLKAAILGVPLPLCSCGVIPTGVSFKNQGASNGATVSFLISTPQTGIDSILVTYSMMSGPWALFRPFVAFVSGVFGGWFTGSITQKESDMNEQVIQEEDNRPITLKRFIEYSFYSFLGDISRPLVVGVLLAAGITLLVPDSLFTQYLTSPNLNMLIILVASIPLYVCATGSVPIGAALLAKGLSPGAVLVFLMAGPATNAATITVLWNALGKKTTMLYVATISFFALLFGYIMNSYLPSGWFQILPGAAHNHQHLMPRWLEVFSAVVLIGSLVLIEFKKIKNKLMATDSNAPNEYKIEGMTCNHCKANVEKALGSMQGINSVEVSLEKGSAKVEGDASAESIKLAIEQAGYKFIG